MILKNIVMMNLDISPMFFNNINNIDIIYMNIYDNIKEIIYINLEKRKDREEYINKFLKEYFNHIKITRFKAIEPKQAIKYPFIKEKIKHSKNANQLPGITGCYSSHICILNRLFNKYKNKDTNDFVLIVEDDTQFNNNFIDKLKEPLNITDWNIMLGINPSCNVNHNGINKYDDFKNEHIFGTNVVIYNLKNIKRLYRDIINIPVIIDYDFMLKENIDNIYFFDTKYIQERGDVKISDIRSKIQIKRRLWW
tara:strand:+ start:416 stop:1171 length:756 start_codon:yes stop_codon:yes gene_type:complete